MIGCRSDNPRLLIWKVGIITFKIQALIHSFIPEFAIYRNQNNLGKTWYFCNLNYGIINIVDRRTRFISESCVL
ncbi:hypothetical protein HUJ05_012998 [Dendroctonus ponderosae]|nr:hypothetical protein HUJ05_012998 [Dendroctonus ponderosae]